MNELIIPKGVYCYDENGNCPYFTYLEVDDGHEAGPIVIPYCAFLKQGSMPNGSWKNNEFDRLLGYYKTDEDEVWGEDGILGLDLLWDQCKSCGVNDYNDDEV